MTEELDDKTARAGEYALGLMPARDASVFEGDLSKDPELRAIYANWAEGLVSLDGNGEAAPASVKAMIDKRLFLGAVHKTSFLTGLFASLPLRLATIAVIAGVGGYSAFNYATGPFYDVQAVASVTGIEFDVRLDVDQRVVLISSLTETLPADRDHELWLIPAGGAPISLGVMESRRTVDVAGDFNFEGALIAVSVEQTGGSPTGQPTTTPIAVVPLTAL